MAFKKEITQEVPETATTSIEETKEAAFFGPLYEYIKDEQITDVDYNGRELWINDCNNFRRKVTDIPISQQWVRNFAQQVANKESKEFNKLHPVLEAETEDLRISIVDPYVATTGTSICIRKTPTFARITVPDSLATKYATPEILSFLINAVKSHCNIIVCGEPGVGKTECCKFISQFIAENERVITIEDSLEWHFSKIKPRADCIEMQVHPTKENKFTFTDAIVTCLRQNPRWMMIAEIRGEEAKEYVQALSTGVNGITTLHTDDVRNIPDRVVNMVADRSAASRMESDIYTFVDVGVLVNKKMDKNGHVRRFIDQIGVFTNDHGKEKSELVFDNGKPVENYRLPESIYKKFKRAHIDNPYQNDYIDSFLHDNEEASEQTPK